MMDRSTDFFGRRLYVAPVGIEFTGLLKFVLSRILPAFHGHRKTPLQKAGNHPRLTVVDPTPPRDVTTAFSICFQVRNQLDHDDGVLNQCTIEMLVNP